MGVHVNGARPDTERCVIVRSGELTRGRQGATYGRGISGASAGATRLCLHPLEIPAGTREGAHLHEDEETALVLHSGSCVVYWGPQLEHRQAMVARDFFFIPAGVPHLPVALTDCLIYLARSSADQYPAITPLPHLDVLYERMAVVP